MSIFDKFTRRNPGSQEIPSSPVSHGASYRDIVFELSDNIEDDKLQYPEDEKIIDEFFSLLEAECKNRYGRREREPVDATARFYVSEDRMKSYACLLPPINYGSDMDMERFLSDMRYDGVCYGVLEDRAERYVRAKSYLHVFPIARGTPPKCGAPGKVIELFQRREAVSLDVPEDTAIDFASRDFIQPVRSGDVICEIQPPTPGESGKDVTGRDIPCQEAVPTVPPMGENTRLTRDGSALVASKDGILYTHNGNFYINPQKVINGDLSAFEGTLRISGNLLINGSVSGGVKVEAAGDIIITGGVRDAFITSTDGTVRIQEGISGLGGDSTVVKAARQIQTASIEQAKIEAGGDIITEMAANSHLSSGGAVYVSGGRGLILDCYVLAARHVTCHRLGNLSGKQSYIIVGYTPETAAALERIRRELAEVLETREMLWKNIGGLRRAGGKLSDEQKALLKQLVEQRNLYEVKEAALKEQHRELKPAMKSSNAGWVRCQEVYPVTTVQIGEHKTVFTQQEKDCYIHVRSDKVLTH